MGQVYTLSSFTLWNIYLLVVLFVYKNPETTIYFELKMQFIYLDIISIYTDADQMDADYGIKSVENSSVSVSVHVPSVSM